MQPQIQQSASSQEPRSLEFIKAVARYFMDFLETDFHKRRAPKRTLRHKDSDNLLVTVSLKDFDALHEPAWKAINAGFFEKTLRIKRGAYQTSIPEQLLEVVRSYTETISDQAIAQIAGEIAAQIEILGNRFQKDYDQAFSFCLLEAERTITTHLITPLTEKLSGPLSRLRGVDESSLHSMHEELGTALMHLIENRISALLYPLIQGKPSSATEIQEQLLGQLSTHEIRILIKSYFDDYKTADLFQKIHELIRNQKILDKQDFYLYIGEVSFENSRYPLVYIPLDISSTTEQVEIGFDSRIYINTKALNYVRQQYNKQTNKRGSFAIPNRIIYLSDEHELFSSTLNQLFDALVRDFELDHEFELNNPAAQSAHNQSLGINNHLSIALFDKSDEAIINDYEEILNLSPDSELVQAFDRLIEDFIHRNPTPFENQVDQIWNDLETEEKLCFETPIPLNEEQYKVISALKQEGCNYIIVEGPPGTGKSHSITAIVFDAILSGQSVLVLSDKKEALDVVESKISKTMNTVRLDKNFQNPILRLGETGSTYNQILSGASLGKIEDHVKAVSKDLPHLSTAISDSLSLLHEQLGQEIAAYEQVELKDLAELAAIEQNYSAICELVDLQECLNQADPADDFDRIHACLQSLLINFAQTELSFNISQELTQQSLKSLESLQLATAKAISWKQKIGSFEHLPGYTGSAMQAIQKDSERLLSAAALYRELGQSLGSDCLALVGKFPDSLEELNFFVSGFEDLIEVLKKIQHVYSGKLSALSAFQNISEDCLPALKTNSEALLRLRHWLFGFLFKRRAVEPLERSFKKALPNCSVDNPAALASKFITLHEAFEYALELRSELPESFLSMIDYLPSIHRSLQYSSKNPELLEKYLDQLKSLQAKMQLLLEQSWSQELPQKSILEIERLYFCSCFGEEIATAQKSYAGISQLISLQEFLTDSEISLQSFFHADLPGLEHFLQEHRQFFSGILSAHETFATLRVLLPRYLQTCRKLGIHELSLRELMDNRLLQLNEAERETFLRYLNLYSSICRDLGGLEEVDYFQRKAEIEQLVTAHLTFLLDRRVVDFTRNFKSEARVLRQIIRSKKQFPKQQFAKLKEAFPCILAGIRDYAEYIPLEADIFDLVIIDEASQVSIAQAFPALLRAKKVLVLGDQRQFSNVKSALARTDFNREYLNQLELIFRNRISEDLDKLEKLKKFNIKTSILDFFEYINNYRARLLKHFRGYPEIISYSNRNFYSDTLQVMKIRGKSADQVLKFSILEGLDPDTNTIPNTNPREVRFICEELLKLKSLGIKQSVGIITPHTNQARLLNESVGAMPERDFFFEHLELKIMTFDTCQGEERDIIFYSMVASPHSDKLGYIFIKAFAAIDLEEEGAIKAQRLNVGFSRARECMHFVLSKPVEQFSGEIRNALRYYQQRLEESTEQSIRLSSGPFIALQNEIFDALRATEFWRSKHQHIQLAPDFELGNYLSQLDSSYRQPEYRLDILLAYQSPAGRPQRIILEYDAYYESLKRTGGASAEAAEFFYSEAEVYMQKILQGYGYKFLRINAFNSHFDLVRTLNQRLQELTQEEESTLTILERIKRKVRGLDDGSMKQCPKCSEVLALSNFFDDTLLSKYGRVCKLCKAVEPARKQASRKSARQNSAASDAGLLCPRCQAPMRLRNGSFGKFYGCSRFPYCRGTRQLS